jgi:prepilin-type N-terminal cleavage/methylation domain-containing protein
MHSSQPCAPPRRRNAGFSIIELMIVVVIISFLAMLALPTFNRLRRASQSNRFVSDLRVFAQAFEGYVTMNGGFPPASASGVVPPGMQGDLKSNVWTARNSLGGQWSWDNNGAGVAGIATTSGTAPLSQMILIDARIDDGDLSNGLFQQSGARFIYYMQQ